MGIENGDKISDLNPLWPLGTDPVSQGDDQIRLIKNVMVNDALGKSEGGTISADLTVDGDLTVDNITASDGLDITGDTSITGDLSFSGTISPPYPIVPNANILINPSFTVSQRGDVIDHNNASYGPDRWKVLGLNNVGGTMSQSTTVVDPATGINKLLVKHRNATSVAYVLQYIEAVNLQGLYSKEMTFSFSYSDVGGSGIPKVEVVSFNSLAGAKNLYSAVPTSLGDNRWTCTFTLSTTDGTIPDPSEAGMQVVILPNEGNTAPNEWRVWETKLEAGSVATPFVARSYGEELALCQRYFQQIYHRGYSTTGTYYAYYDKFFGNQIEFNTMRSTPSASFTQIAGSFYWANPGVTPFSADTQANFSCIAHQPDFGSRGGLEFTQIRTPITNIPSDFASYRLEADIIFRLDAEL